MFNGSKYNKLFFYINFTITNKFKVYNQRYLRNIKMSNPEIINTLEELRHITEILGEPYKEKAYRKAIMELKRINYPITNSNMANIKKLPGIGKRISDKITELINTGSVKELESLRQSEEVKSYDELSKILGVGPKTIEKWLKKGINSLAKLREAIDKGTISLTTIQQYGLEYYNDLNSRIPRTEVTTLGNYIKQLLIEIDPDIIFEIAGSYRRNASSSGDIDILVSNKHKYNKDLLMELSAKLENDSNYIDTLSRGHEKLTFLYRSQSSGKIRQIDVLNIEYDSYYAALLYFTGGADFNEAMRGYAKSKGYRLNQAGLYQIEGRKLNLVPAHSEKEIFDILGLKYIEPEERNEPNIIKLK
jgi:DNA polymerase/3'-5' exonuclease PolX